MLRRRLASSQRWERDLYVLWITLFIFQIGFSSIMPFLPLFLEELNVQGPAVDMWAGVIFSASFVTMTIFSPIWGGVSDRIGRKPMMLRSAFSMSFVVLLMGFAQSPWHMLGLRMLLGVASGLMPAAIAYMASTAPREHAGQALGMLSSGGMAGSIIGPLLGGALSQVFGYRPIFFLTAALCLISGLVVMFTIHEEFTPVPRQKGDGVLRDLGLVSQYPVVKTMMVVLFLNMFSVLTVEPILARFLRSLSAPEQWLSFLSGLVFSITGVATVIVAPRVGRLSDRIGSKKLLAICLGGASIMYLVQSFATAVWHMVVLRFLLGLFSGGIMPAANGLIARTVPREVQGRVFGITNSAIFIGNTLGPVVGGTVAANFGVRTVFPVTGAALLTNMVWVLASVKEPQLDEAQLEESPEEQLLEERHGQT